jgi:hypothetical protein
MKGFRTISDAYRTVLLFALAAAVAVFGLLLLTGCTTTKYVPIETVRTDTLKVTKYERDSIYIHDSTIVREKGDTMLIEKWHTRWRDRWMHDTVYQSRVDSVPKPYPVTEYVERKRSKLDWFFIITGIIALIAVIVYAAIKVRRFLP